MTGSYNKTNKKFSASINGVIYAMEKQYLYKYDLILINIFFTNKYHFMLKSI